jgi:hypothetical protein
MHIHQFDDAIAGTPDLKARRAPELGPGPR